MKLQEAEQYLLGKELTEEPQRSLQQRLPLRRQFLWR